jgi:hypothetical protein
MMTVHVIMLSSSRIGLTNRRIRPLSQARLVRGTSRAIVGADDLYVDNDENH